MAGRESIHIVPVVAMLAFLTPSTVFGYAVLWDTSHGVVGDGDYQPSGYYQTLVQHLGDNGFTVDTTSDGFHDPIDYDVIVVCLASAYDTAYTSGEVERILSFVNNGGGLLIMGDRQDRPGKDNEHIQPVADEFGIALGISNLEPLGLYTSDFADHPIFDGIGGIYMYAAGELAASSPASEGAWKEGTGEAIAAVAEYGQGRVVGLGDCSLWTVSDNWDYFHEADNPQFSVNTFEYLAVPEPATLLLLGLGCFFLRKSRCDCAQG
ncbi:MAG: DUF4350 domain-containing protein [Planctomycetota bacterium]